MSKYFIATNPNLFTCYGGNLAAYECRDHEVLLWAASETGKTMALLQKVHLTACLYPNAQLAIVRKTYASIIGSVLQTWEHKIIGQGVTKYGKERPEWYDYPNGSRVWIIGMDNPTRTLSSERDLIYVNQAEELTVAEWEYLVTRTTGRAGNIPYPQLIGDCNPAHPTHWIRTRKSLTRFQSHHVDNPTLFDPITHEITEQGKRSLSVLDTLSGARRARLLLGIWAQEEGAIFDIFDEKTHTIPAMPIPKTWPRVVGIDPMGAHVAAVWIAYDPKNMMLHVYREYNQPFGVTTAGHVKNILELTGQETIFAWCGGGPSERQARMDIEGFGIPIIEPPFVDVWAGIDRVYSLLKDNRMVIHDSCPELISQIGSYKRKVVNGQVVQQIENKEIFDVVDATRYGIAFLSGAEPQTQTVYDPVEIGNW